MLRSRTKCANSLLQIRKKSHLRQVISFSSRELGLTEHELETIEKLPFFDQDRVNTRKRYPTTKRQAYLNEKLPAVKLLFGEDPQYPGFISHSLPSMMPIPFEATQGTDEETIANRLSVTKLLTKSWCELRHAYDVYAKIPMFEGKPIIKGKEEHQRLEDETHSLAEEQRAFEKDFEVVIPDDDFHKLAESWFASLVKMVNLFTDGEAREVLCHGYLNKKKARLVEGPIIGDDDDDVLVSGIIDHLILKLRDVPVSNNVLPLRLENAIVSKNCEDIAVVFDQLERAGPNLQNKFEIMVSDVKTRFMRKIPSQPSVLKASKLQVMYYRYFMEVLGQNPQETYNKLLINAQRRGFDVNRFIDPAKVLSMMATDDMIRMDMYRLKNGDAIGFEPFDDSELNVSESATYDMSDYHDIITDARVIQKYSDFFEPWAKPVTLKYFAARLAQMYHHLRPLLSNKLMIEYYYNGDNFHNIIFEFDPKLLRESSSDSAKFWFGQRDIEPISRNLKNFLTFCKYCDYESVCSWKRGGNDMCKELGTDLAKIQKS
ncbi:hypothetical protein ZYGR_0U00100 [Zygosaccharomyces rouxii]|uniref:Exonuclease V, mitochondrial n=1 Tax=Zygosaccharomyces rouxii TaxID=4956 RepID=A0A1Q3A361_ZYGRO|nr:hypothetical protein ZYGR_0U00100 [Zygosaccharomyces rouxii]